jgi:flagellar motor switch protein FliN/FliY
MPAFAEPSNRAASSFPPFTQNLLRIKVPVMVTLAQRKQPVQSIVELVPGSIIQFNKSCEEMLELEVSGEPIAQGECVKVGDKFGLRLTSMILPAERFQAMRAV